MIKSGDSIDIARGDYELVPWSRRRYFAIHHSSGRTLGDPDPVKWLQAIDRYHTRGGGHPSITAGFGYNLAMTYGHNPVIYEARGIDRLGAHISGHNTAAIGMVVLGDYRDGKDPITVEMAQLAYEVWQELNRLGGVELEVVPHGQLASTACPGDKWERLITDGRLTSNGKPTSRPGRTPPGPAVDFPLPRGHYYGPSRLGRAHSGGGRSGGLAKWVEQLRRRGWPVGKGRRYLNRYGSDGFYGPEHRELIVAFQRDQGLAVDGLLGARTWRAAYHNPVTP